MSALAERLTEPLRIDPPVDDAYLLKAGERLDQATFHARYEATPEHFRAELIGGIVYMPSPVLKPHSRLHAGVSDWLNQYELSSPGTETLLTPSVILSDDSEPEPDAVLRILSSHGGRSWDTETNYIAGAPELLVEVSHSTVAFDLKQKKAAYERAGVQEYLVLEEPKRQAHWFELGDGRYHPIQPGEDGVLRSRVFPGLWLLPVALFAGDRRLVRRTLRQGINSPEHKVWVKRLAAVAKDGRQADR